MSRRPRAERGRSRRPGAAAAAIAVIVAPAAVSAPAAGDGKDFVTDCVADQSLRMKVTLMITR